MISHGNCHQASKGDFLREFQRVDSYQEFAWQAISVPHFDDDIELGKSTSEAGHESPQVNYRGPSPVRTPPPPRTLPQAYA